MSPSVLVILILALLLFNVSLTLGESHCWRRKYDIFTGRVRNATVRCAQHYQWTVNEYCCYDRYDSLGNNPFCCYSETYKLLIGAGIICAMVLGSALLVFLCWLYNVPHYVLRILTCGKFSLNEYMKKAKMTGPYVDPSFYAGEPFWTSEGSEYSHYPLRPMPPKIFYPVSTKVDLRRWSNHRQPVNQTPLFILASRQFTRNPYSARPNERGSASSTISGAPGVEGVNSSRRSSTSSCVYDNNAHRGVPPSFGFKVHIGKRQSKALETSLDEVDAASELLEALKTFDDKSDKNFVIPKVKEETQWELELDRESELKDTASRDRALRKDTGKEYLEIPVEEASTTPVPVYGNVSPPQQLDASKLCAQSQRTLSGTLMRRNHMRGASVDSTSSAFTLESISEEHHQSSSRRGTQPTPHSAQVLGTTGSTYSPNIPGYIPEENELAMNDRARKAMGTA